MPTSRSLELRVGVFVTLALIVGTALVFTLGNRSALFASQSHYRAVFGNVDGLRPGSPIRMSGMDVGTVGTISFQDDGRCVVTLNMLSEHARFVTEASRATIGSKGLLGDKLVDITPGAGTPLPEGSSIETTEGGGMFGALASAGSLLDDARPVVANVREFTDVLAEDQLRQDIRDIVHNLAELSRMAREDDGTVHRLLSDPGMADSIQDTLASVRSASGALAGVTRDVRAITTEIRSGDGTAHEIVYGADGRRLIGSLADTAGEAATILRDVRTGDGNMHELLYGDDAGGLIQNLTAMTADLQVIVAEVRAGRGTIGGLLMDPSIYEDVRRLVGNLERNEILRALVRYSIREDEPREPIPPPEEVSGP